MSPYIDSLIAYSFYDDEYLNFPKLIREADGKWSNHNKWDLIAQEGEANFVWYIHILYISYYFILHTPQLHAQRFFNSNHDLALQTMGKGNAKS